MILAAALLIAAPLVLVYLAWDCWRFVRRPRNRYRKDVLPPPARETLRLWRVAE